ncbi:IS5 family transposase ISOt6 [Orientia tsutsugamushi]|nr:IS5 family transposase ISOt6 [Orientia tsutsugamushi]
MNENVIGMLKRFKIIANKYRNMRKRLGLRFNLISGIYNFELPYPVSKEVYYYSFTLIMSLT